MNNYVNQNCADAHKMQGKENFEANQIVRIMTRDEAAKFLRVHPSTVSRYTKSGELRSFKLGSRRLFKYEDVLSFFENQVDREYVFGKEL